MIFRGDKQVTSIYRGDKEVVAVYRGADKVWEKQATETVVPQSTIFSGTVLTEQTRLDTINDVLGLSCSSVDEAWATVMEMAENGSLDLGDEQVINTLNLFLMDIPAKYDFGGNGVAYSTVTPDAGGFFSEDLTGHEIKYGSAFKGNKESDVTNSFVMINCLPSNTSPDDDFSFMFAYNPCLAYVDVTAMNYDWSRIDGNMGLNMFSECAALNHIRCTKAFRDWCWANAAAISLPDAMREGGNGTWELVDDAQQIM